MNISIITVFPELHKPFIETSIIARAVEKNMIAFNFIKLSDMCAPKERIDEPTCGHGSGMIIKPEVIEKAITKAQETWGPGTVIFFSPQGKKLTQRSVRRFAQQWFQTNQPTTSEPLESSSIKPVQHIILVCSRYEGIDARVEQYYGHHVISIGDYVLMGGDLPAQVFLEAVLRLLPGVVGKQESVEHESFSGPFLDHPEYGLPVEWKGLKIPDVVRSGNHQLINEWRKQEACKKTILNRFDWFASSNPNAEEKALCRTLIPSHYVVLMHTNVVLKGGKIGNTSVASLDIHDIARSSATYGVKNYFIVTPQEDQQEILQTFLGFWRSATGKNYNESRYQALTSTIPARSFDEVIQAITQAEGKEPVIISTSAKASPHQVKIDFTDQGKVWSKNRPVLIVFGTGQGLSDEILNKSDFLLVPINGLTEYNHLSVRAAASIILDRWLGLHPHLE
jgi:tRNA (guanine37-N1)-methyltransferase